MILFITEFVIGVLIGLFYVQYGGAFRSRRKVKPVPEKARLPLNPAPETQLR